MAKKDKQSKLEIDKLLGLMISLRFGLILKVGV
jgi:hypothetical protein